MCAPNVVKCDFAYARRIVNECLLLVMHFVSIAIIANKLV